MVGDFSNCYLSVKGIHLSIFIPSTLCYAQKGFTTSGRGPRPFIAFTAPGMEDRSYRITSLGFSPQGEDVLVSYSSEHLYLFSIKVLVVLNPMGPYLIRIN